MPKKSKVKLHGLVTALITPFDALGRVDTDALSNLVRLQIAKGAAGLFPCGSTGLGPLLKPEERMEVAETVVREASGKVPIAVQVGCADTPTTVKLARHAEKIGADLVASLTPYYYHPGEKAVVRHFESVALSVDIPLLAYNIPQFTGNNLLPATVAALAKAGTIAGVKDSSRDVLHLLDLLEMVPEDFVVMNGTEEYALIAMMMGGDGLVSGGANAFPELFRSLVASHRAKDYAAATNAQRRILEFKEAVKVAPIPSYYEILRSRGIDCGNPRPPFLPLENETAVQVVEKVTRIRHKLEKKK